MAQIIGIMNNKGGAGKTTVAINLADGLARRGFSVLLGDLDEGQDSALCWGSISEHSKFLVKGVPSERLTQFIERHNDDYDIIIIDCPPRADRTTGAVVRLADICLCPVAPSPLELWSLNHTAELIKDRQALTGKQPVARVLLNKCIAKTKLLPKSLKFLHEMELDVMATQLTSLEAWKQVFEYGESVYTDLGEVTNAHQAREQMEAVVSEVLTLIQEA